MKNPMPYLLSILVIGLMIAGFIYLDSATHHSTGEAVRKSSLIAGITCISLSTGLVVLGVLVFRKKD